MNRPIMRFHNTVTNEIIDREMNDEEFAQWQKDQAASEAQEKLEVEAKTKRQAILDRLGLTEEEAKLLLG